MAAEPSRVGTVNPVGLELSAQCTVQMTQVLSDSPLLGIFLADDVVDV
jgi:hypothetical protein